MEPLLRPRDTTNIRDRMFTALFYRVALTYARTVPQKARRVIEFMLLSKVRPMIMYENGRLAFYIL